MVAAFKALVQSNSPVNPDESEEEEAQLSVVSAQIEDANTQQEVNEYMRFESECETEFDGRIKRHSCTIHRLQTAVRAFEKDEKLKSIINWARIIVRTFRMSHVATGELLKATGLTLIADVSTRWNSTLLSLRRLDEVREPVKEIMARHLKIPGLTPGEWLIIKFIIRLLEKCNTVTDKLSADKEATIHPVHFYMNGLVRHLE
ncbi:hypothetical protein RvY_14049 [Ramazzottius varieornatus]|uniref:Uncharacterized protein n=1 Tax=Ramazzottius varieornatus TaxID=947166 RepID=A0A1D1VQ10_RAMVA|nr:hypothetical protein RvY_14049 [Ramazzottius varieornatus]